MTLIEYIHKNFGGSKKAFAEAQGVKLPQVTQWLKKDIIVVDGKIYSFRREINRAT